MLDPIRAEARCVKIQQIVQSGCSGEIELLRAARTLRRIHAELVRGTREQIAGDRTRMRYAEESLATMEGNLKRVLLNYPFVNKRDLHDNVMQAARCALRVLDLLDQKPVLASA